MSKIRGWGIVVLVLGVLLVAGGLVVMTVVYPSQAMFPDDVDTTRAYEGELGVMLNADALASGDLANLFIRDVPVTIERQVQTVEVGGDDQAIVSEDAVMSGPAGPMMATRDVYAIDRVTMESTDNFANDPEVIDRTGLVIGFPIGTEAVDYVGWNGDTMSTVTIEYVAEEERGGLNTYRFHAASLPEIITDPVMLASFPEALPKTLLAQLATVIELPAGVGEQLGAVLEQLPDQVPLAYTYAFDKTYWVEPTSGVLIDVEVNETRSVALPLPGSDPVPLTEVQQLGYVTTEASVADAVADAEDASTMINLFGTIIPWGLMILGGVLVIIGLFMILRRPPSELPASSAPREKVGV